MQNKSLIVSIGVAICLSGRAYAFNTNQHLQATGKAADAVINQPAGINQIGGAYPDIQRFRDMVVKWSGGANAYAGIGAPLGWDTATPAEELAHVLDQTKSICDVPWNNGDFPQIFKRITDQYNAGNFGSESPFGEGAYVLMGSAIHLIEDQASMPHGANIHHGACPTLNNIVFWSTDNFENPPTKVNVEFSGQVGANVSPDQAYVKSLMMTRNLVGNYKSPSTGERYWYRNEELAGNSAFTPQRSATPYIGAPPPVSESLFGSYGGVGPLGNFVDIYNDYDNAGLYLQQGTQATDFAFFFLKKMSELLPPVATQLAIIGISNGPLPVVGASGAPVTFTVSENRSQGVTATLFIKDTCDAQGNNCKVLVSDGADLSLDGLLSASGNGVTSAIPGPAVWRAQPVQLFMTKNDVSLLPFQASLAVNWKGAVDGGDGVPLADGNHTLCLRLTDDDDHNTANDSCVGFVLNSHLPIITMTDLIPTSNSGVLDYLYENYSGVSASIPSTIIPSNPDPNTISGMKAGVFAWVNAVPPATLASVVLSGPTQVNATLDPGSTFYYLNVPAPLPVGTYALTATDSNGNQTVTPVAVATMTAAIVSEQLVVSPISPCVTSGQITFDFAASLNLDHLTMVNQLQPPFPTPTIFTSTPLSGTQQQRVTVTIPSMTPIPFALGQVDFITLFDSDGNTLALNLGPNYSHVPNTPLCLPGLSFYQGPMIRTEFAGEGVAENEYTPLGLGASVSNLQITGSNNVILDIFMEKAPRYTPGFQTANSGNMYGLMVEGAVPQAFSLSLPVSSSIDPNLLAGAVLTTADGGGNLSSTQAVTLQGANVSFPVTVPSNTTNTNPYVLNAIPEVPLYANPAVVGAGGGTLLYNGSQNSGLSMSLADITLQPLAGLIAQARALGLLLTGPAYLLGPEGTALGSPGYLTLPAFQPGGAIYELSAGLAPRLLSGQSSAYQSNLISGVLNNINSYFAVFTSSPVPTDSLPPRTALDVGAPSYSTSTLYAAATTTFSLTAVDDSISTGDAIGVGVAQSYLSVDGTTYTAYAGTFSLTGEGTHTISYYSVDLASHAEVASTTTVFLDLTPPYTNLLVNGAGVSGPTLTVLNSDSLGFAAVDAGAGVDGTEYFLDIDPLGCDPNALISTAPAGSCANPFYAAPFTVSAGTHTLSFYSFDFVENVENVNTVQLLSISTAALPPPVFSGSQASSDGSSFGPSSSTILGSATAETRISVQDGLVGISTAGFSVSYSNDGGATWNAVPGANVALTATGASTAPYTLSASGIPLVSSLSQNQVAFSASGAYGKIAYSTIVVLDLLPVSPPAPTDHVPPIVTDVVTFDSSGTALGEGVVNNLLAGIVAQANVRDLAPGLNVSRGLGVMYSTSAGQSWINFSSVSPTLTLPGGQVYRFAAFNGKLYAGSVENSVPGPLISASADGVSWATVFSASPGAGNVVITGLCVYNGKLYAAYFDGTYATKIYSTSDGTNWTQILSLTSGGDAFALATFNGTLFAGTVNEAQIYATGDGTNWIHVLDAQARFNEHAIDSMAVFNGKLYAGTEPHGRAMFTADGVNWSTSLSLNQSGLFARLSNLTVFNGKLYASADVQQNVYVPVTFPTYHYVYVSADGVNWAPTGFFSKQEMVLSMHGFHGQLYVGTDAGNLYASPDGGASWALVSAGGGGADIFALMAYGGNLYSGELSPSQVRRMTPLTATLSGSDGATSTQTLTATGLNFAASTNSLICGGVFPCGATDQVWFSASDLAGNVGNSGPRSVLIDSAPPAAVADLAISSVNASSVTLSWTAPAALYTLTSYDLRRATYPITAANFFSATPLTTPSPAASGVVQTISVTGVVESSFYAALVSRDAIGGASTLSNVAGLTRSTVVVGGAAELAFSANQPVTQVVLSTAGGTGAVVLASATASGFATVSSIYDLGPEGAVFVPNASLTIRYSTAALTALGLAPGDLMIYEYVSGSGWVALSTQTLDATAQTVTAAVPSLSSIFALLGKSHVPPLLALAPPSGSTVTVTAPQISAVYSGGNRAIDTGSIRLLFDGVDVTTRSLVTASSTTFTPTVAIAQGTHTVSVQVADFYGNRSTASATFLIDSIPPVTSLLVDGAAVSTANAVLVATDTIGFSATDGGTGVAQTLYLLGGATQQVYVSTFSLAVGSYTLSFQSRDFAGNMEAPKTVGLVVVSTSPTTPAPAAVILSPEGQGFDAVVQGQITVVGTAVGQGLSSWRLESAPGQNANAGFVMISSGASAVSSGTLALWNTSALSGWQTLRLTSVGASTSAVVAQSVYVGIPATALTISGLNGPQGVATALSGSIYVADTHNNRVAVFSSTGGLIAAYAPGNVPGLVLNLPSALTVDPAGNIFVADTNDNKVEEISASGQLLLTLSNIGHSRGIALDASGNLYAGDSDNARVQKFSHSGALLQTFSLSNFKPAGIALDASGELFVVDSANNRVVVFSTAGALLQNYTGLGLSGPFGIAVDAAGGAVTVADSGHHRVVTFDRQGNITLSYAGSPQFNQVQGLAQDAGGNLFVVDRNRNDVLKLGAPASSSGVGTMSVGVGIGASGTPAPVAAFVPKDLGGVVARADHAAVVIPPSALPQDMIVTVSSDASHSPVEAAAMAAQGAAKGLTGAAPAVDYGPEGTQFAVPVTIVLPFDASLVSANGLNQDNLKVYYWNPALGDWQALDSTVDPVNRTVAAQTTHFSAYQVMGAVGSSFRVATAAQDAFALRAAYAFPNPARGAGAVTIRIQTGLADSVEVRVYDLSGRRVYASSDFQFAILDDGNGLGAQDTYDHAWDVSGVGSGVYTYVITARKSGAADVHKTGKIGVIK